MIDSECVWYQSLVSVWLAVGSLHVLDLCLQQCLCVRMHYGPVHDCIQPQCHSSMLAYCLLVGVISFLCIFWMSRNKNLCFCGCALYCFITFVVLWICGSYIHFATRKTAFNLWCQDYLDYINGSNMQRITESPQLNVFAMLVFAMSISDSFMYPWHREVENSPPVIGSNRFDCNRLTLCTMTLPHQSSSEPS